MYDPYQLGEGGKVVQSPRAFAAAALALLSLALTAALVIAGVAMRLSGVEPIRFRSEVGDVSLAGFVVALLTSAGVGALVAARRPRHPVGWLLIATTLGNALALVFGFYLSAGGAGTEWAALATEVAVAASVFALLVLLALFPDGRLPVRRRKRLTYALIGAGVVLVAAGLLRPGPLWVLPQVENPMGIALLRPLTELGIYPGPIFALGLGVMAVAFAIVRWRSGQSIVRQQLKWLLLPAIAAAVTNAGLIVDGFIFAGGPSPLGELPLAAFILATGLVPVAIGIAILRYRLYEIDLIIRRTLVYGVLTVVLGALYGASVVVLQGALSGVTGGSGLAVAASTLAIAALFQPVRRWIQRWVDRRFYRSRYDAHHTLSAFSARQRSEVDLKELSDDLLDVVRSTLRPAGVSIWLRPRHGSSKPWTKP